MDCPRTPVAFLFDFTVILPVPLGGPGQLICMPLVPGGSPGFVGFLPVRLKGAFLGQSVEVLHLLWVPVPRPWFGGRVGSGKAHESVLVDILEAGQFSRDYTRSGGDHGVRLVPLGEAEAEVNAIMVASDLGVSSLLNVYVGQGEPCDRSPVDLPSSCPCPAGSAGGYMPLVFPWGALLETFALKFRQQVVCSATSRSGVPSGSPTCTPVEPGVVIRHEHDLVR